MRLWHLCVATLALGLLMTVLRNPTARLVFIGQVLLWGEVLMAVATLGFLLVAFNAILYSTSLSDVAKSVGATIPVLLAGPAIMLTWLLACFFLAWATQP